MFHAYNISAKSYVPRVRLYRMQAGFRITLKPSRHQIHPKTEVSYALYNTQINARALIGQSAMVYCASKPMENLRVLRIII